ncbi:MAG: Phosphoribosylformylglycinamidine cyclo-ligase [Parcubacteria group bacterium Athens0416_74]|nr:MAG: Phosphoribosylformylglycinamidine cyclo-ligase [Parcubacteria group bacterium Athens0416_74]
MGKERKPNAYALAGVDVDVEAEASRIMYEASKKTFENRTGRIGEIVTPFDDFAGLKMVNISKLPEGSFMSLGFDGAGTKVEIAERVGRYNTIAFDLFAMVCDDALIRGGESIVVGSNLDIKSVGMDDHFLPIMRQLGEGYIAAAKEANVAVINGEIAQMGSLISGYGEFPFHWGAACIWVARKEKILTGTEMKAGDAVVMLQEKGFRCNGLSLVRKIMKSVHGEEWHTVQHAGSTLGELTLTPSRIYSRFVAGLHGGFDTEGTCEIHGVAHITGGGVPEKMIRVLRRAKLGARLENLFDPGEIVQYVQRTGSISDYDAYRAWNMGQGMALITPEPEKVLAEAVRYGMDAQVAGEIIAEPRVVISSKGVEKPGQELSFDVD